jgi:5'-nucleotidase (lipoprotein e(P4) family)
VKIYYISDRFQENKADTIKTPKKLNIAQVSSDNVLLYTESKETRRDVVRKEHEILMLIGDSLHDFAAEFKNKESTEYQRGLVAKEAKHFGNDWIVMPNASYGSWSKSELKTWDENVVK